MDFMDIDNSIKETSSLSQHEENKPSLTAFKRRFSGIVFYMLLVFIIALILLSPVFRGLYFEKEWYIVHLASFGLFLLWWCYRFFNREEEHAFGRNPMDFAALFLVICFFISLTGAVHLRAAIAELLKVINYFVIYLFVHEVVKRSTAASREKLYLRFLNAFLAAGIIVAVVGLTAAAGILKIPGLFDGTRIHSTLQYHNGNAVYLSAMFFLALGLPAFVKRWTLRPLYLAAGLLLLLSIVFTYSRGGWLVLLFSSIVYILFSLRGYRLRSVIYLSILAAAALISFAPLNRLFREQASFESLGLFALLLLAVTGAGVLIELVFLSKANKKKLVAAAVIIFSSLFLFFVPFLNASAENTLSLLRQDEHASPKGAVERLLPRELTGRVSEIDLQSKSVKDRFIYFKTAYKIAKDYPVTGAGGGAWEALYLSYFEDYYPGIEYTKEVHNHYLKVLIESGVPGFIAFLGLWFFFLVSFLRFRFSSSASSRQKQLFLLIVVPAVTIGAHSAIDFGLSLGAISIALWILFALGSSFLEKPWPVFQLPRIRPHHVLPYFFYAACAVLILFLNLFTYNLYSGYLHGQRAYNLLNERKTDAAVYHLEQAAAKDPYRAAYLLELAAIHEQSLTYIEETDARHASAKNEALALASRGVELEPNNYNHIARYGTMLLSLGETEKGLEQLSKLPELFPYSTGVYRYVAFIYLDAARAVLEKGEVDLAYACIDQLENLEEMMLHYLGNSKPLSFFLNEANLLLDKFHGEDVLPECLI